MNDARPIPPLEVPMLTEVVNDALAPTAPDSPVHGGATVVPLRSPAPLPTAAPPTSVDADALFMEVLDELREQVDRMVAFRLREALAPVVARTVDRLVDEVRGELDETLQDVVRRSLTQVMARNRPR